MRKWTVTAARDWIKRVDNGKEKMGLKYCSAKSFLRGRTKVKADGTAE